MACCCKGGRSNKSSVSCLGRCDIPKHRCIVKEEVKPGPIPKHMGWLYTAKDAPQHQLRCGWRPGHISCSVLKKIEQHNCMKGNYCSSCSPPCLQCSTTSCTKPSTRTCYKPPCTPPACPTASPSSTSCCKTPTCPQPSIRIIRHGGEYSICTKPSNVSNAPSGPFPLKYVLNTDSDYDPNVKAKYSVEAKYNDYHFDYTSSQASFVLDFSPPETRCNKPPCAKKPPLCIL